MIERLEQSVGRTVSRETVDQLRAYEALVRQENEHQNLVSNRTLDNFWDRHVIDSAQLVRFEPHGGASWVDIGSGAGLPGIVVACLVRGRVTLVEPRRLRAQFLHRAVESLGLDAVVVQSRVESIEGSYDVITARAVAPLAQLLKISHHLSTRKTVWAFPKGRNALVELADAQRTWQGAFHVERSATDEESSIIVATGVRARQR